MARMKEELVASGSINREEDARGWRVGGCGGASNVAAQGRRAKRSRRTTR